MRETWLDCDLKQPLTVQAMSGNLFSGDDQGNLIGVRIMDGGEPAAISGNVFATVIRDDGRTVMINGELSENRATVILPAAAYAVPGVAFIAVKIGSGLSVTTVAAVTAIVQRSETDEAVDPGTVVASIGQLIEQIETAVESIPADWSTLWWVLGDTFTAGTPYKAGDIVTYSGNLYKFLDDYSGSWNPARVTPVVIGNELVNLRQEDRYLDGEIRRTQNSLAGLILQVEDHERWREDCEAEIENLGNDLESVADDLREVEKLSVEIRRKADGVQLAALAVETDRAAAKAEQAEQKVEDIRQDVERLSGRLVAKADGVQLAALAAETEQAQKQADSMTGTLNELENTLKSSLIAGAYAEADKAQIMAQSVQPLMASRFAGKVVSIIGDSIETFDAPGYKVDGYAMFYPIPIIGISKPEDCWWMRVINQTGAKLGVNAAYSGSRVTNTLAYPDFYARTSILGQADMIIVSLGTNDSGGNVPLGEYDFSTAYTSLDESTFRTAYIKGIKALKALYPGREIVCVAKIMGDGYKDSIATIAETLGCIYIDASGYESINGAANPHPRAYGMRQIASMVLNPTDRRLKQSGMAADAQTVGQELTEIKQRLAALGG